jgi:DNA-binding response OmpR family regulator
MKTILIVDDDADFAEAIRLFLQANGFRVIEARDGKEGLRLARMERPDLVIMDIVMRERTEGCRAGDATHAELKDAHLMPLAVPISASSASRRRTIMAHDEFSKPV